MKQKIIAYGLSVIAAYLAAVVLVSQFNIARVVAMGFEVSFVQRIGAIGHDLVGMLGLYLPMIAISFLIAFAFTGLALLRFIDKPNLLYPLAGFTAIVAIHLILEMVIGLVGIAPTRTVLGLVCQGLAGALGGYCYARYRTTRSA